jgi:hypothetical protein
MAGVVSSRDDERNQQERVQKILTRTDAAQAATRIAATIESRERASLVPPPNSLADGHPRE